MNVLSMETKDDISREEVIAKRAALAQLDFGDLPKRLGMWLKRAQLASFQAYFEFFGDDALRPGEFSSLYLIWKNPGIRQGVLGEAVAIKRANMAKIIRSFERTGLVTRSVPDDDRRAVELYLTPTGQKLVAKYSHRAREQDEAFFGILSADEAKTFKSLLRKLVSDLDRIV